MPLLSSVVRNAIFAAASLAAVAHAADSTADGHSFTWEAWFTVALIVILLVAMVLDAVPATSAMVDDGDSEADRREPTALVAATPADDVETESETVFWPQLVLLSILTSFSPRRRRRSVYPKTICNCSSTFFFRNRPISCTPLHCTVL